MNDTSSPRRIPRQARSGDKLFALEELALQLLIQGGRSAVTPKALMAGYQETRGRISKQWVSDYMGDGDAIVLRLAVGHFKVMSRYAEEAGALALMSPNLEEAAKILAHHVMGGQDPWFGQAHPALCAMIAVEGHSIHARWTDAVVSAAGRVLPHFQPRNKHAALAAGPAAHALIGAWYGLVLAGRQKDENRQAYLAGAFLGVARSI